MDARARCFLQFWCYCSSTEVERLGNGYSQLFQYSFQTSLLFIMGPQSLICISEIHQYLKNDFLGVIHLHIWYKLEFTWGYLYCLHFSYSCYPKSCWGCYRTDCILSFCLFKLEIFWILKDRYQKFSECGPVNIGLYYSDAFRNCSTNLPAHMLGSQTGFIC